MSSGPRRSGQPGKPGQPRKPGQAGNPGQSGRSGPSGKPPSRRQGLPSRRGAGRQGQTAEPERKQGPVIHDVPVPAGAEVHVVGRESGMDLAHYLAETVRGQPSVRAIRRALDQGHCLVNGRAESFGSRKLRRGDVVAFIAPSAAKRDPFRYDPRRLAHRDARLVVYDKPPGLPVVPTDAGKGPNLLHLVREGLRVDDPDGSQFLEAAHRIDADTSGLVLFARDAAMLEHLRTAFAEHTIEKSYEALVRGRPRPTGERKTWLALQERGPGYERWGSARGEGSLHAITAWTVTEQIGRHASLVRVQPRTGRTHQIRVHFAEMDHPLFGDRVYGDRKDPVFAPRHLLHASRVVVPLPDGGTVDVRCRTPRDFLAVVEALRALG